MTEDEAEKDPRCGVHRVELADGKTRAEMIAELALSAPARHALISGGFSGPGSNCSVEYSESLKIVAGLCGKVRSGDLSDLTDMLAAQSLSLDAMFTEYSRRAMINIGEYPAAVDRYMALATKAQSQCRTTVETLARIKRDGKQTVKVVHVHEGGQAVVADTFHQGGRRGATAENDRRAHEQAADAIVAALPRPDPARDGMPLPSFEGKEAVQAPRRKVDGPTKGQSQRMEARRPITGSHAGKLLPEGDGAIDPGDGPGGPALTTSSIQRSRTKLL